MRSSEITLNSSIHLTQMKGMFIQINIYETS